MASCSWCAATWRLKRSAPTRTSVFSILSFLRFCSLVDHSSQNGQSVALTLATTCRQASCKVRSWSLVNGPCASCRCRQMLRAKVARS